MQADSKGKQKALGDDIEDSESSDSGSSSYSSDEGSDAGSDSSSEEHHDQEQETPQKVGPDVLPRSIRASNTDDEAEDDIITLEKDLPPLPPLDPGISSFTYLQLDGIQVKLRDPDVEKAEKAASISAPAPPIPPPEVGKYGKVITKKQKKELRAKTAGRDWFDLPAPSEAELPRLYHEVEALRLRNQLDPKRFYRKDEGEGKGIKGLPKYFAIGTILPTETPFGTPSTENIPKSHRKRTIVDELVDDAEAKSYAKKKFKELQVTKEAKGKKTLAAKKLQRKPKW